MTPDEADRVVKIISAAWGYFANDDTGRVALWTGHIERMDFDPTRAAAHRLAETHDDLPSLAAFLRAAGEEARIARLAAAAPSAGQGEGTYGCRCGEMRGWVVLSDDPFDARPCPECRPATYEQWGEGHYDARHDRARCAECRRIGRAA